MYFHGSPIKDISVLKPSQSLHDQPYVYLVTNKVVAMIYCSNAIQCFYEDNDLEKPDKFQSWYSYGFNKEGVPVIEEYYPNAFFETYKGRSGFVYTCKEPSTKSNPTNIYCAFTTKEEVIVLNQEMIEDLYDAFLTYEKEGKVVIKRYSEMSKEYLQRIYDMIREDIETYDLRNKPEDNYTVFLKAKFPELFLGAKF